MFGAIAWMKPLISICLRVAKGFREIWIGIGSHYRGHMVQGFIFYETVSGIMLSWEDFPFLGNSRPSMLKFTELELGKIKYQEVKEV